MRFFWMIAVTVCVFKPTALAIPEPPVFAIPIQVIANALDVVILFFK